MGCAAQGVTIDRSLLTLPAQEVAPRLLGARLRHRGPSGTVTVEITEVEAYAGEGEDPASHAHRGRTARNAFMFDQPGTLYVYFVYGVHWCMNVVTGEVGRASAVLIRAGDVVEGVELAQGRRNLDDPSRLAQGPANVAVSLGVAGVHNGTDLLDPASPVRLLPGVSPAVEQVASGPRVGISRAVDRQWRWWLADRPSVSRPRTR
jgi:DNA-3-methyladenine glycosylase